MNKETEDFLMIHQTKVKNILKAVKKSLIVQLDETYDEETVDRVLEQYDEHLDKFVDQMVVSIDEQ